MTPFNDLLGNLAFAAISTSVWTLAQRHIPKHPRWLKSLLFGTLMSLGTTAVMSLPFHFSEGVYVDLRYTFLAVAGLFGGPLSAGMCLLTAVLLRVSAGGTGLNVGLPLIMLATASGLFAYNINKGKIPSVRLICFLSTAVAASGTLGFFIKLPWDQWSVAMPTVVAPFAMVLLASTALTATAVMQEMRRQAATDENRVYRAVIEALPAASGGPLACSSQSEAETFRASAGS